MKHLKSVTVLMPTMISACSQVSRPDPRASNPTPGFEIAEATRLPEARGGHAAGMIAGRLVVAGGTRWNESRTEKSWLRDTLILREDEWTTGSSLPHAVAEAAYVEMPTGLFLAGGQDHDSICRDAYLISADGENLRIQTLPPLPNPVRGAGCAQVDGVVYVIGGQTPSGITEQVWALDLSKTRAGWYKRSPLPASRAYSTACASKGNIYVLGGGSDGTPLVCHDEVYRYDTRGDRWALAFRLTAEGNGWSATCVDTSHALLAGRAHSIPGHTEGLVSDEIWLIDLSRGVQELIGHAVSPTITAPLVRVGPGEWWLLGGEPDGNKTRTARVTRIRTAM